MTSEQRLSRAKNAELRKAHSLKARTRVGLGCHTRVGRLGESEWLGAAGRGSRFPRPSAAPPLPRQVAAPATLVTEACSRSLAPRKTGQERSIVQRHKPYEGLSHDAALQIMKTHHNGVHHPKGERQSAGDSRSSFLLYYQGVFIHAESQTSCANGPELLERFLVYIYGPSSSIHGARKPVMPTRKREHHLILQAEKSKQVKRKKH